LARGCRQRGLLDGLLCLRGAFIGKGQVKEVRNG